MDNIKLFLARPLRRFAIWLEQKTKEMALPKWIWDEIDNSSSEQINKLDALEEVVDNAEERWGSDPVFTRARAIIVRKKRVGK